MIDGAVRIDYSSVCPYPINVTDPCKQYSLVYYLSTLLYSIFSLVLNAVCMSVFIRQSRHSVMRISLLLLSTTEVLFHTFFSMDYLINIIYCSQIPRSTSLVDRVIKAVVTFGSDGFICTRNWCNVLITAARTEVVARPLKIRRCFTRKTVQLMYVIIFVVSCGLSLVRMFYDYLIVCYVEKIDINTGLAHRKKLVLSQKWMDDVHVIRYETICYFVFQIILPLSLVLIMSTTIVIYVSPLNHSDILGSTSLRRRHQMNATRTILFLAAAFMVFQLPSFIMVLLQHYTDLVKSEGDSQSFEYAHRVADLLLITDSVSNILIYTLKLPEFRHHITMRSLPQRVSGSWPVDDGQNRTVRIRPGHREQQDDKAMSTVGK